jgi:hypothetical protein
MSLSLPDTVNYAIPMPSLPSETQMISVSTPPSNGSSFSAGSQVNLDLINRGFLVPDSMYLSYKVTVTQSTASTATMRGCPAYTPFRTLQTQIGSQSIDNIQSYNVLMNMLTNGTLDVAQKYGLQTAYGYGPTDPATGVTLDDLDGHLCDSGLTDTFYVSAPLMSVLSNADKLLPLFLMPAVRLSLTLDSISSIFTTTNVPTGFTISEVNLNYRTVDMGSQVEALVRGMGAKLFIKSQSFGVASQTLNSGASGNQSLIFNQRYASCKSIIAINGMSTTTGNMHFSSCGLVAGSSFSFTVAGVKYPQRDINSNNHTQALMEFKGAMGSIFDRNNSHSINAIEYSYNTTTGDTYISPGKKYIATSLEKLDSNSLLTGISTQNSPINYNINLPSALGASSTITCIVNFDAIFEIDVISGDCILRT